MKNTTVFDIKISAILKVIFVLVMVWLIIQLQAIIIAVFIAFIIATAIRPLVKKLQEYKIPRSLSITAIYLLLILFISFSIYLIAKPLAQQLIDLAKHLPEIAADLQANVPFLADVNIKGFADNFASNLKSSGQDLGGNLNTAVKAVGGVFDIFTSILTIIVLSVYLTIGLDKIIAKLIKFVPKDKREFTMRNYGRVEDQIGAWVRGQLFLMILIGVLTYISLLIVGLGKYAVPLAIFAGLMEILPIVGPLIYSTVIIIVAFTIGIWNAVGAAIFCLIIQQAEGNFIVPAIMKKAVGLSPVTTILAILVGGTLMGIIGALLAVPVAAVLSALLDDLFAKD